MISSVLGGKGISHLGRGFAWSAYTYIFRDQFLTDDANPLTTPRTAEPGPGTWTVTDVEGVLKILNDRLRGGTQPTSPVWGDSRLVGDGISRATGRVLAARITIQDSASDLAFGFATATNIADPRTDGHGWLMENTGGLYAIIPGVKVPVAEQPRNIRPMQYLAVIALDAAGAALLLSTIGASSGGGMTDPMGIPAYPSARVVWVDGTGTDATLYPYVSFLGDVDSYPDGHAVEDARVVDVAAWSSTYYLATVHDEFTRADSTSSLGGSWAVDTGTWGISSNRAYIVSGTGSQRAYLPNTTAAGDGIVICDITAPNPATTAFGLMLRRVDANNFIRLWNNNTNNSIHLQTWVSGGFGATIDSIAQTWVAGQTYRIVVAMVGNRYSVWVDGVKKMDWKTDVNNRHLTATSNGILTGNTPTGVRWDNFAVYPLTVTLPDEIGAGAVPHIFTGGLTLASDTFTDTDAVALDAHAAESGGAWTEQTGVWTVQGNKAAFATGTASLVTQSVGQSDVECQVEITTPGGTPDVFYAGIVVRWTDANNYIFARILMNPSQVASDEIELWQVISGSAAVVHKVNIADYFAISTTYTMKVQAKADLIHVWLDGKPLISFITGSSSPAGNSCGLYGHENDDGCVFDNWTVKQL